jgi:hypothetical protein
MARVSLYFRTQWVAFPGAVDQAEKIIRLVADIQFALPDGQFTEVYSAVFDTGAPFSVLPEYIWQPLISDILVSDTTFGGISRRKECQIEASFGIVQGRIVDEERNTTGIYSFHAFLAKTDRVPLILGFADLMEELNVQFNYRTAEAWIE